MQHQKALRKIVGFVVGACLLVGGSTWAASPACQIGSYAPYTYQKYYENQGLTIPADNTISAYSIQWFYGGWSPYVVGVNDLDPAYPTQRRAWAYFTDHNFQITACNGTGTTGGSTGSLLTGAYTGGDIIISQMSFVNVNAANQTGPLNTIIDTSANATVKVTLTYKNIGTDPLYMPAYNLNTTNGTQAVSMEFLSPQANGGASATILVNGLAQSHYLLPGATVQGVFDIPASYFVMNTYNSAQNILKGTVYSQQQQNWSPPQIALYQSMIYETNGQNNTFTVPLTYASSTGSTSTGSNGGGVTGGGGTGTTNTTPPPCVVGTYSPYVFQKFYENQGLNIPVGNQITSYEIQWFNGSRSQFTVGVNDLDPAYPTQRRAWAYFTDHNFKITSCGGSTNGNGNGTGITYGYGYGYTNNYGYGYGYGYLKTMSNGYPFFYVTKPYIMISYSMFHKFHDLQKQVIQNFGFGGLPKGSVEKLFDINALKTMQQDLTIYFNGMQGKMARLANPLSNTVMRSISSARQQFEVGYAKLLDIKKSVTSKQVMTPQPTVMQPRQTLIPVTSSVGPRSTTTATTPAAAPSVPAVTPTTVKSTSATPTVKTTLRTTVTRVVLEATSDTSPQKPEVTMKYGDVVVTKQTLLRLITVTLPNYTKQYGKSAPETVSLRTKIKQMKNAYNAANK